MRSLQFHKSIIAFIHNKFINLYLITLNSDFRWTGITCFYFIHSVCLLQWDFYRVARSFSSADDIERRRPASANPTKTSPTWATTFQLLETAAARSPAVFLGDSSSASLSARQANQKAKAPLLTEVQAHWETDCHSGTWLDGFNGICYYCEKDSTLQKSRLETG